MRYGQIAVDNWPDLHGEAVARGLGDPRKWPITDLCSFVWWFATHGRETKAVEKFRNRLWQPPRNNTDPIPANSPWSPENELSSLRALKAQVGAR